jgi:hypothetical protein
MDCDGLRWIASQQLQVLELGVCARWPMIAIIAIYGFELGVCARWPMIAIDCH